MSGSENPFWVRIFVVILSPSFGMLAKVSVYVISAVTLYYNVSLISIQHMLGT